ncbi:hypothetical protein ACWGOQ_0006120 [Aquimarina sp. M1]
MKKNIQIKQFSLLILLLLNCYTLIGQSTTNEVTEVNKELIEKLFDSIGYRSIYLVLKDRVYESDTTEADKIKGLKLDDFSSELRWDGEKRVKSFVEEFIKIKQNYLDYEYTSEQEFKKEINSFTASNFFKDSIITLKKENDKRYLKLKSEIQQDIELATNNFKVLEINPDRLDTLPTLIPEEKKQPESTQGFGTIIKDYSAILLIILIISLVLNILLGILFFRIKKRSTVTDTTISDISETTTNTISIREIERITKEQYTKWINTLSSTYTNDCVSSIRNKLDIFKSKLLLDAASNQFFAKDELQIFIEQRLKNDTITFETQLKKCNDRQQAKEKVEQEIQSQSFIPILDSEAISTEEIHIITDRSKRNLINELPITINDDELLNSISEIKQHIELEIAKRIRDNLRVYFPFADDQGTLSDDKKSKIKERDSAIQLIIDPNDTSRGTFSLLYDYPDMMQAGIQSYDVFLLPICNLSSENFNRTGTTIEQIGEDGEMQLEGNQWKVIKKLTIKII